MTTSNVATAPARSAVRDRTAVGRHVGAYTARPQARPTRQPPARRHVRRLTASPT